MINVLHFFTLILQKYLKSYIINPKYRTQASSYYWRKFVLYILNIMYPVGYGDAMFIG
jgi:hypothetical protein